MELSGSQSSLITKNQNRKWDYVNTLEMIAESVGKLGE